MTLEELKTQLLALTPPEKVEAMQILTHTLSNGSLGITKTPGVAGGDACIAKTRIPVWGLVSHRNLEMSDAQILKAFPHLTAADLVNAWIYADSYPEEIAAAIQKNDDAMEDEEV